MSFAEALDWAEARNAEVMRTQTWSAAIQALWDLVALEIDTDAYQHLLFELNQFTLSLSRQFFEGGEPISVFFSWNLDTNGDLTPPADVLLYGARPNETCDVSGAVSWDDFSQDVQRRLEECKRRGWRLTGGFSI